MGVAWLLGVRPSEPTVLELAGDLIVASPGREPAPDVGRLPSAQTLGEESETSSGEDAPAALEPAPLPPACEVAIELAAWTNLDQTRSSSSLDRTRHNRGPPQA